jgi:hypothetical protein
VRLSAEEMLQRGKQLAAVVTDLRELQARERLVIERFRRREGKLLEDEARLGRSINEGEEPRKVAVTAWADFESNTYVLIREDTGETVEQRPLRPEERQGRLLLEEEPCEQQSSSTGSGTPTSSSSSTSREER